MTDNKDLVLIAQESGLEKSKTEIVPEEERLMAQEKFAERLQAEKDNKIETERHNQLSKYVDDSEIYSLHPSNLTDKAFEKLLGNSKLMKHLRNFLETQSNHKKAQKKAEQDAEAERIENEKKEKIFNERKFELVKYSDFIEIAELTIDSTEQQFEKLKNSALLAYKKHQEEQEKIRKENEKLQKEKEKADSERLKAEQELVKQKEAQELKERQEREVEEARRKAEEEAKRQALLAPDKDKLNKLAADLDSFKFPAVESQEAGELLRDARGRLDFITNLIREKAKTLNELVTICKAIKAEKGVKYQNALMELYTVRKGELENENS